MVDIAALRSVPERHGRLPRLLDVACETGIFLSRLLDRLPGAEAYGVDGSEDMLAQARTALKDQPHVHLERVHVGTGETACLPFAQETFGLITCTNALHDLPEPLATLSGLRRLLTLVDNWWWKISHGVSAHSPGQLLSGCCIRLKEAPCMHIPWPKLSRFVNKRDSLLRGGKHSR